MERIWRPDIAVEAAMYQYTKKGHTHTKIKIKNDKKRKVIKWGHKARNKMESLERKEKRRLRDRNEVSTLSSVWCP